MQIWANNRCHHPQLTICTGESKSISMVLSRLHMQKYRGMSKLCLYVSKTSIDRSRQRPAKQRLNYSLNAKMPLWTNVCVCWWWYFFSSFVAIDRYSCFYFSPQPLPLAFFFSFFLLFIAKAGCRCLFFYIGWQILVFQLTNRYLVGDLFKHHSLLSLSSALCYR